MVGPDLFEIERAVAHPPSTVTSGQMEYEWRHLMSK